MKYAAGEAIPESAEELDELLGKVSTRGNMKFAGPGEAESNGQVHTPTTTTATMQPLNDGPPKLALEQDILSRFGVAIRECGVVGEDSNAKTLYLMITSRVGDKPASAIVKGSSSSGKSYVTEEVRKFFPDSAVVIFTGMSERALVLSQRDYRHKTIIIYEAAALRERAEQQSGNQTAMFIRTLISEGRTVYEMSVKDKEGGWTTKLFEKEGPTNAIITTTAVNLHNENETRMLSLQTDDGRQQTRNVLLGIAAVAAGREPKTTGYEEWHELQGWIERQHNEVTIPFADHLARNISDAALIPRVRRDFKTVLALVEAHAVLHQATRDRDERDRIIATWGDYTAVRDLVLEVVSQGVGATVRDTIRETVAAVENLAAEHPDGVTAFAVGKALGLDKSTAYRRLGSAMAAGYVINEEERRGRPGRYKVGEPMPDGVVVLPDQPPNHDPDETPGQGDGCMVATVSEGRSENPDDYDWAEELS